MSETPRVRLSRLLDERRRFLRLTWGQVAADASISYETIRQVRSGLAEIRPLTKRGLEDALDWAPGSVDTILAGGDPVLANVRALAAVAEAVGVTDRVEPRTRGRVEALIAEIYDSEMPESRKHELVRLIRHAEARREAELRAAQDELERWRRAS